MEPQINNNNNNNNTTNIDSEELAGNFFFEVRDFEDHIKCGVYGELVQARTSYPTDDIVYMVCHLSSDEERYDTPRIHNVYPDMLDKDRVYFAGYGDQSEHGDRLNMVQGRVLDLFEVDCGDDRIVHCMVDTNCQ